MEASLPRVAVQFAREIFGDFLSGDVDLVDAFVAKIHNAFARVNRGDGVRLARLRRRHFE
jgi:hypothetical protein